MNPPTPARLRLTVGASIVGAVAGATYAATRWNRMTRWGATDLEVTETLPGDEIVKHPRYSSTHAVTIHAPARKVWPWLVQMGQGRGGLYSYDWLENLVGCRMHSIDHVDPNLQHLAVGDVVRMVPEGTEPPLRFVVAKMEEPTLLVLGPDRTRKAAFAAHLPYPCWTFQLVPDGPARCRLLVRFQHDFAPSPGASLMYRHALQPVHFMMERKMMLAIKARAEHAAETAA